jgi:hypothetical protein
MHTKQLPFLKRTSYFFSLALFGLCSHAFAQNADCVGEVITPPSGLVEVSDDALLASALGAPGKGALCKGKVYRVDKLLTVYRVWDGSKAYTALGRWWSLNKPVGPRDKYRVDNDICPEWSPLDKMNWCIIKIGTKIVIGPGQSAQCASSLLPASATNQVFIPNDTRNNITLVEYCSTPTDWPEAAP